MHCELIFLLLSLLSDETDYTLYFPDDSLLASRLSPSASLLPSVAPRSLKAALVCLLCLALTYVTPPFLIPLAFAVNAGCSPLSVA